MAGIMFQDVVSPRAHSNRKWYTVPLSDVTPAYPDIARSARVQGIVIVEAVIGPDGKVEQARVLRSQPLLDEAALAAVRGWEYTPTLLNGKPTAVIMTVTVQFTLKP